MTVHCNLQSMPSSLLGSLCSCRCASLLPSTLYSTVWISTCCSMYVGQSICCGARGETRWLKSGQDIAVPWPLLWPSSICCVLASLLLSANPCAAQFLGLENRKQKRPKKELGKARQRSTGGYLPFQLCKGRAPKWQSKSRRWDHSQYCPSLFFELPRDAHLRAVVGWWEDPTREWMQTALQASGHQGCFLTIGFYLPNSQKSSNRQWSAL